LAPFQNSFGFHSWKVNGPVPIGASPLPASVDGSGTTPDWAVSTLGNETQGALMTRSTLRGPVTSTPVIVGLNAADVRVDTRWASKSCLRASEVSGTPLWNVMSGRSVTVHRVKSAFGVMDSARYGWGTESTS
jgi:hypothetical protein